MQVDDLDRVLEIERLSFPEPWPRRFFIEELRKRPVAFATVATPPSGEIVGYMIAWFAADEIHIGNLATNPRYRGRGVAKALLARLVEEAGQRGATTVTLEVRASNRPAVTLYARNHFRPVGLRRAYYRGGEDAIIMRREL